VILFGLRDTGSVNVCLPVISILKGQGIPVSIYAEGFAQERLKEKLFFIPERKMDHLLNFVRPLLVVLTVATKGGSIPIDLNNEAKQRNLPTVLVEEIWGGHAAFRWNVLPDAVCVYDEFAKSLLFRSWPGYSESHVHITNMPIFDRLVNIQTEFAQHKLREALDLREDWPVVFFAGQAWGMPQAIKMFVEALNDFDKPVYLILTDHPAVVSAEATYKFKRIYSEYRKELNYLQVGKIVDPSGLASSEIMSGSDFVVGICSTMTIEACYLRKPVLTIWTPEIGQSFSEVRSNIMTEWPTTNLGASLKAENVGEIKNCLQKILAGDTADMMEAQQKHFKTDGLSGERIAKSILNYYRC
jgi:UDP-N-acetylglucosamine:LPS N-acetylglucosamine transferase